MPVYRRSIAGYESLVGTEDARLGLPLSRLGEAELGANHPERAIEPLQRALAIYAAAKVPPIAAADVQFPHARELATPPTPHSLRAARCSSSRPRPPTSGCARTGSDNRPSAAAASPCARFAQRTAPRARRAGRTRALAGARVTVRALARASGEAAAATDAVFLGGRRTARASPADERGRVVQRSGDALPTLVIGAAFVDQIGRLA